MHDIITNIVTGCFMVAGIIVSAWAQDWRDRRAQERQPVARRRTTKRK
jgi:hypothetical protein